MLPLVANADTSANLITNGTFDNGTTGWTTSGDAQVIGDCCRVDMTLSLETVGL